MLRNFANYYEIKIPFLDKNESLDAVNNVYNFLLKNRYRKIDHT